ncbi:HAD family phosphatase [uncultured Clostridium sp.]|uniref:HAD family hydrolase n=1 Tax=uncultured Clostridium sp. TaxID=59620 RepID=UPI0025FE966F|nr:HAD family hydrolase [uncultured Clostridium sp.]
MNIEAVIFDMDGVIIDSEPLHRKLDDVLLSQYGIKVSKEEQLGFIGVTSCCKWERIKRKYNLSVPVEELIKKDRKLYLDSLKKDKNIEPIKGVDKFIKFFYERNLKLAIASSSPRNVIEIVIGKFELEKYFYKIISGDDVKNSKPSPDIFLKAAELLKVKPSRCMVVEDSKNGVEASKNAGMYCTAFRNLNSGNQELTKADLIVDSFDYALRWFANVKSE